MKNQKQTSGKSKAHTLLASMKSVAERADKYADRIKKSLSISIIDNLQERIEKIDDKIFDLENFALETNLNKGMVQLTKEDCEKRFASIIDLKFEQSLLQAELDAKKVAFDELFN